MKSKRIYVLRYWDTKKEKDAGVFHSVKVNEEEADYWIEKYGRDGSFILYKKEVK